jgi:hypothetical protein
MGILTYARQNLRVELKESWYEHLCAYCFVMRLSSFYGFWSCFRSLTCQTAWSLLNMRSVKTKSACCFVKSSESLVLDMDSGMKSSNTGSWLLRPIRRRLLSARQTQMNSKQPH